MHYELLYIVPIKYTEDELKNVTASVSKLIEKAGGKITKDEDLGKKKLAYPIKESRHGYYILNEMDMEPSGLQDLNKALLLTAEILRYQIVKRSEETEPRKPARIVSEKPREEEKEMPVLDEMPAEEREKKAKIADEGESKKMSMEDLDRKLDEILEIDED